MRETGSEVVQRRQGFGFIAAAVQVTESYISQLLARKKAPPAPGRTDIYEKIGQFISRLRSSRGDQIDRKKCPVRGPR